MKIEFELDRTEVLALLLGSEIVSRILHNDLQILYTDPELAEIYKTLAHKLNIQRVLDRGTDKSQCEFIHNLIRKIFNKATELDLTDGLIN